VIIATGCRYATDGMNAVTHDAIPGVDCTLPWQATPPEIVLGSKEAGQRVLVFESEDYFVGPSIAQLLAAEGHEVTLVTPHATLAHWMDLTLEGPMMQRDLRRLGVKIITGRMLDEVKPGVAITSDVWAPDDRQEHAIDSIVVSSARISNAELYAELRSQPAMLATAGIEGLFVTGSAAAPGMLVDSIFQAHRLAREIDSPDPSRPLPFIRERRIWGATDNSDYERALRIGITS
jgi:dimethylamine/trimethylamine dehydrogenase